MSGIKVVIPRCHNSDKTTFSTSIPLISPLYIPQPEHGTIAAEYPTTLQSHPVCFDFALTLPEELRGVWGRPFVASTAVYFVARCEILMRLEDATLLLNYLSFSAFTMLVTYVIWGKSIRLYSACPTIQGLRWGVHASIRRKSRNQSSMDVRSTFLEEHLFELVLTPFPVSTTDSLSSVVAYGIVVLLVWTKNWEMREIRAVQLGTPHIVQVLRRATFLYLFYVGVQVVYIVLTMTGQYVDILIVWSYFEPVHSILDSLLARIYLPPEIVQCVEAVAQDGHASSSPVFRVRGHGSKFNKTPVRL
ncbi:hypothetical protein C8Q79DRAFT_927295 [Trametes meyenii]|nr:hypothetical protein C8Q79DRAFT_927295 [Trametes meyenii]